MTAPPWLPDLNWTPELPAAAVVPARGRAARLGYLTRGRLRRVGSGRGRAALALRRDVRDLALGQAHPQPAPAGDPEADPAPLLDAARLLAARDTSAARGAADRVLAVHPTSLAALELRRRCDEREGRLSDALRDLRAMRAISDLDGLRDHEAALAATLLITDPRWLPWVPGTTPAVVPAAPTGVLHIAPASQPWQVDAATRALAEHVAAERAAGLEPIIVTAAGFPRRDQSRAAGVELVDGVPCHRLEMGPAWPGEMPPDRAIEITTWLTARIVRRERPAALVASARGGDIGSALIGLALRAATGLPLILEGAAAADLGDAPANSELADRLAAARDRALTAADVVVAATDTDVPSLVARGVRVDRIVVSRRMASGGGTGEWDPASALAAVTLARTRGASAKDDRA